MQNKYFSILRQRNVQLSVLAILCTMSSFWVGIETAGDVQPFTLIEAGSVAVRGDVDGSGNLDVYDAIEILEISQGYKKPTLEQLHADPNDDGVLTVDDAIRILSLLANR